MIKLDNFDFKVPSFWETMDNGFSTCYPRTIVDIFSTKFDSYFFYQHPIILEEKYIQDNKFKDLPTFWDGFRVIPFQQFLAKLSSTNNQYIKYTDYTKENYTLDNIPDFDWGAIKGSQLRIKEIQIILNLLLKNENAEVILHYDHIRNLHNKEICVDEYYQTNIFELLKNIENEIPNYILDINRQWCITIPYDDYITLIACNSEFSNRLKNQQNKEIYEIQNSMYP